MKIELQNVKTYPGASEETIAMGADVVVDGKVVGTLTNSGRGEGYFPHITVPGLLEKMHEWAKSQPPVKSPYGELSMSLDFYLSMLVHRADVEKQVLRQTRAGMLYMLSAGGEVLRTKKLTAERIAQIQANPKLLARNPGERLLTPQEAIDLLVAQA